MKNTSSNLKKENRTQRIDVRLTKSEYDAILAGMKDSLYTTKGAYLRAKLLNKNATSLSKKRYLAILAAGQLRDTLKRITKDCEIFTKVIQTPQTNLKASDKALIEEIGRLVLSVEEKLQNADI